MEVEFLQQEWASAHLAAERRARVALRQFALQLRRKEGWKAAAQVQCRCSRRARPPGSARRFVSVFETSPRRSQAEVARKNRDQARKAAKARCPAWIMDVRCIVGPQNQLKRGEAPGQDDGTSGRLQGTAAGQAQSYPGGFSSDERTLSGPVGFTHAMQDLQTETRRQPNRTFPHPTLPDPWGRRKLQAAVCAALDRPMHLVVSRLSVTERRIQD